MLKLRSQLLRRPILTNWSGNRTETFRYLCVSQNHLCSELKLTQFRCNSSHVITERELTDSESKKKVRRTINDARHYLRSTEFPERLRQKILLSTLCSLAETRDYQICKELIPTINQILTHFQYSDGNLCDLIPPNILSMIFLNTFKTVLTVERPEYPPYMGKLALRLLKGIDNISSDFLLDILEMSTQLQIGNFKSLLAFVLKYRATSLPKDFCACLLRRMHDSNRLNLGVFESLVDIGSSFSELKLVNDDVVTSFNEYLEDLFKDTNPYMHEYKDLERNIYRVSYCANKIILSSLGSVSTSSIVKLLSLKASLNSIAANEEDRQSASSVFTTLAKISGGNSSEELKRVLFKNVLFDESISEIVLLEFTGGGKEVREVCSLIAELIAANDVKYSSSLRLRAELIKELQGKLTLAHIRESIDRVTQPFLLEAEDKLEVLADVAQAVARIDGLPSQQLYEYLSKDMAYQHNGFTLPLRFFHYFVDCAVRLKDASFGRAVFKDSVERSAYPWNESSDPCAATSLNRLILLILSKSDILEAFEEVQQIWLNVNGSLDALSVNSMIQSMLGHDFVGDAIEVMTRALPRMKKDSFHKLPVSPPWSYAHRQLFNTLVKYVITSKADIEANWALYGEIHNYFQIPFESYMPVMKFFCEEGRLNAALIILRTVKLLNELHGAENCNPPPLRDMYMYLLQVFGDKLYEEGVQELHEYIKMDVNLDLQDIELQNCLLNAYTNLQDVGKARDIFLAISANSKEDGGVNEETAQIMLKAYTYSGLSYVDKFWNNLSTYEVFPNIAIFKQYVIACVYHGDVKKAIDIVAAIDDYNLELSPDILLAMHNYCFQPHKQEQINKWLFENHAEEWKKLQLTGSLRTASKYDPEVPLLVEAK